MNIYLCWTALLDLEPRYTVTGYFIQGSHREKCEIEHLVNYWILLIIFSLFKKNVQPTMFQSFKAQVSAAQCCKTMLNFASS